jgi:hypothetical protein
VSSLFWEQEPFTLGKTVIFKTAPLFYMEHFKNTGKRSAQAELRRRANTYPYAGTGEFSNDPTSFNSIDRSRRRCGADRKLRGVFDADRARGCPGGRRNLCPDRASEI